MQTFQVLSEHLFQAVVLDSLLTHLILRPPDSYQQEPGDKRYD
jgi:hypothetical protein